MSEFGAPGQPSPPGQLPPTDHPPDPPDPQDPGPMPLLLLLLATVIVAGGIALAVLWQVRDDGVDHPDAWDERVAPYASAVEAERKLSFDYPIYVDFLEPEEFEKQVTSDESEVTEEDREELEQFTGLLRALGLVGGDLDLFDSMNELNEAGIIGYYSYEDKRIRIKGTELTPAVRSTLVHELTHALQDQHFELGERFEDYADDSARESAFRALVEGDARRIETAWREDLEKSDRAEVTKALSQQSKQFEDDSTEVPEVLSTMMGAPYIFGEAMLQVALERGGERAVNNLFLTPPRTEEHTMDPWTMVVEHQGRYEVAEPSLDDGEEEFDDGPFGSIGWLVMLAERLPAVQALTAADGWGGDSYVAYERDGVTCVRIRYAGDSQKDLSEMKTALDAWVAKGPDKEAASVRREGSRLSFQSCDPGTAATGGSGGSRNAVTMAVTRTYFAVGLLKSGVDTDFARCASVLLVRKLPLADLNDPDLDPARVARIITPCRP